MNQEQTTDWVFAQAALQHYALPADATVRMISLSENATYLVEAGQPLGVLRVYRPNYQSNASKRSELTWIGALRASRTVKTPAITATRSGEYLAEVRAEGDSRGCALFEFVAGEHLGDDDLGTFHQVGATAAKLHTQVLGWNLPEGFERFTWDLREILDGTAGRPPRWGYWRDGPGLTRRGQQLLGRAEEKIRTGLTAYQLSSANAGLVHGDLRAANILQDHEGELWVIDFDDCGFSWLLWDLCSTTTFIEHLPKVDEIVSAWLDGYREFRSLTAEDMAAIPHLVMLRRLHILAWLGSHQDSDLAQSLGTSYTDATYAVASTYLDGTFLAGLSTLAGKV